MKKFVLKLFLIGLIFNFANFLNAQEVEKEGRFKGWRKDFSVDGGSFLPISYKEFSVRLKIKEGDKFEPQEILKKLAGLNLEEKTINEGPVKGFGPIRCQANSAIHKIETGFTEDGLGPITVKISAYCNDRQALNANEHHGLMKKIIEAVTANDKDFWVDPVWQYTPHLPGGGVTGSN